MAVAVGSLGLSIGAGAALYFYRRAFLRRLRAEQVPPPAPKTVRDIVDAQKR